MIFATFNGLALIHMFFTAPETKGKTLEEMDEVFDSGVPAWKSAKHLKGSKLDRLQAEIEKGERKVTFGVLGEESVGARKEDVGEKGTAAATPAKAV